MTATSPDSTGATTDMCATAGSALSVIPPFIWPDARVQEGIAHYSERPPYCRLFDECGLISGLFVGPAKETVLWLQDLVEDDLDRRIVVVLAVYPAGPTREEHLRAIYDLSIESDVNNTFEVYILPLRAFGGNSTERRHVLPPTVIQGVDDTGRTVMNVGSVGDAGCDSVDLGSFNLVFHPDNALRDAWRRWFQYVVCRSAPLTEATMKIPKLVPAQGDPAAEESWSAYLHQCSSWAAAKRPTVDAETGEVTVEGDGEAVQPWDQKKTSLNPLAQQLEQVYANGCLVTIDEATRIKPLSVPVKATLLGQQSEKTIGTLTQRQSFTLKVLDDEVNKAIEKCRKVADVIELLTFQLSKGNRWMPDAAKALLEKELAARNQEGQRILKQALGGDVKSFIDARKEAVRKDLDEMYQQLGQGSAVPDDKLQIILQDIDDRLTTALNGRITPRAVFNRIQPPNLASDSPDENWSQPLSLLLRAAKLFRAYLTDPYFPRRLSGRSFTLNELQQACNVFGDTIVSVPDATRARHELLMLDELNHADEPAQSRCQAIWKIMKG